LATKLALIAVSSRPQSRMGQAEGTLSMLAGGARAPTLGQQASPVGQPVSSAAGAPSGPLPPQRPQPKPLPPVPAGGVMVAEDCDFAAAHRYVHYNTFIDSFLSGPQSPEAELAGRDAQQRRPQVVVQPASGVGGNGASARDGRRSWGNGEGGRGNCRRVQRQGPAVQGAVQVQRGVHERSQTAVAHGGTPLIKDLDGIDEAFEGL